MRIITFKDFKAQKGIPFSREHLRRLEAGGRFPKRVRLPRGATTTDTSRKRLMSIWPHARPHEMVRRLRNVGRDGTKPGAGGTGLQ